jgi:hypothetical protein
MRFTGLGLVVCLGIAACGGPGGGYDGSRPIAAPEMQVRMAEAPMADASGVSGGAPAPVEAVQYLAYTHSVGVRLPVRSIEPAMQGHIAACQAAGPSVCIVTNSYLYAYSEDQSSGSLSLRATPQWIEAFLSGIEAEASSLRGDITARQTTAEDLTVSIVDTDARLKAQTLLQARLEELLADRPGNLGELLETQRELARVNGEIDSLTSTLRALRARVDMSQLTISYETKLNPVSQGALAPLSQAFSSFFYNLAAAIAAVITAFAYGLPWLLLIGALLFIWLRLIWPRVRRKKS